MQEFPVVLDVTVAAGQPSISGIEFTGGAFVNEQPLNFSLTVLNFFSLDLAGSGLVGTASTPAPPSTVSADPLLPLTFRYDAADHLLSFNEGMLTSSGIYDGTLDLSGDPVSGMPPAGSIAMLELAELGTAGGLTDFTVSLTQPLEFLDTFDVDLGLTTLPITAGVSGQAIAAGGFSLDLGPPFGLGGGDYNNNGRVEQADLDLVLLHWNEPVANLPPEWINQRPTIGIVDQAELDFVLQNWNRSSDTRGPSAGVPEPNALVMGLIAAGLALWLPVPTGARRSPPCQGRTGSLL